MGDRGMNAAGEASFHVLLESLQPSDPLHATVALLRWVHRERPVPSPAVLSAETGSLRTRVAEHAPLVVLHDPHGWTPARVAQRAHLDPVARRLRSLDLRRELRGTKPVYVPDLNAAHLLRWSDQRAGTVISHLHGSASGLDALPAEDRSLLLTRTDRWIAGSNDRVGELVAAGVAPEAVTEIPDLLDHDDAVDDPDVDLAGEARQWLHDHAGVPLDAGLVVGLGAVDWWDVPDALVRVVWETTHAQGDRDIRFVWMADGATERMLWPLRHDLAHAGIEHRVHVVTDGLSPWRAIAAADVLLDTRLGSTAPVGRSEAAAMGLPVLTFADPTSSSTPPGNVIEVGHLDIDAVAAEIMRIVDRRAAGSTRLPLDTRCHPPIGGPLILAQLGLHSVHGADDPNGHPPTT